MSFHSIEIFQDGAHAMLEITDEGDVLVSGHCSLAEIVQNLHDAGYDISLSGSVKFQDWDDDRGIWSRTKASNASPTVEALNTASQTASTQENNNVYLQK